MGNLGADTLTGGAGNDAFVMGRRFDTPGFRTTGGPTLTDADWILDFTSGEDVIELIGGLTFEELNIFSGNGAYAGNTIIQDKGTGEYLAILQGVNDIIDPVSDFNPPGIADPITPPASLSTLQLFRINEDGTPVTAVNITRTGSSIGEVSVKVLLNGGTAIGGATPLAAPKDYDNSFITVNWADGDKATKTVTIPLHDNTEVDGNKTVNLTLCFPTGDAILGDQNSAFLTIVDNDSGTPNPNPNPTNPPILVLDNDAAIPDDTGIVHFGITTVGTEVVRTLTVKNRGTSDFNLGTLNLPNGFSLVRGFDSPTLAAGTQKDFFVKLNAENTGIFNGTFSFGNNRNPYDFTLRGIVSNLTDSYRLPEIEVRYGTVEILDTDTEAVNFGTTRLGTPIRQTFTITNTGTGSLLLDGWQLPRGFSFVGTLPSAIAPGTSDQITVELDGRIAGNFQGLLGVGTNDADEKSFDFPITGTVTTGQELTAQISNFDLITRTFIQPNEGNTSSSEPSNVDITNSGNTGNSIDSSNNFSQPFAAPARSIDPTIATNLSQGSINYSTFVSFTDPQTLAPMQNMNQSASSFLNASDFRAI
ncbi:hemolysin-type calcium-binding region [Microseira wollei NIES-4236]|uniref:Hemolysin-type calcium-binding region n=1 Tax=Microseira wollei NIES-4236 TaxID=2530354 RepID=A0AAV3XPM7_9CYAN|nr:hemolysin-type calcium-binding region [Microseira wollei NIES-4236]